MLEQNTLLVWSHNEHTPEQSAFSIQVALGCSSHDGLPDGQTEDATKEHPSMTRTVEYTLLVKIDGSLEERPEVLDLGAQVFVHDGTQAHSGLVQA